MSFHDQFVLFAIMKKLEIEDAINLLNLFHLRTFSMNENIKDKENVQYHAVTFCVHSASLSVFMYRYVCMCV